VMRVFIELNHPQIWGYHIAYDTTGLLITVKRQKDVLQWNRFTIAVDAGHGGSNVGAAGVTTKVAEKIYTLQFAEQLQQTLTANGFRVIMTRTKDTTVEMADRILNMRDSNPDVLISLHLNSDPFDTVSGTSTYYRYIGFKPLSQYIHNRMLSIGLAEYGNTGSFNFGLSGPTEYPNCLVEIAFLSNKEDEKKIIDPAFQKQVAIQITEGLKDWLTANGIQLPGAGVYKKE
jgi:N-acetylmuramoyl-L-alanine amidase